MMHELKIMPQYFEKVLSEEKTFEIRFDDRTFSVGDDILLKECREGQYTGRIQMVRIIYMLSSNEFPEGLKKGYVILGTKQIKA